MFLYVEKAQITYYDKDIIFRRNINIMKRIVFISFLCCSLLFYKQIFACTCIDQNFTSINEDLNKSTAVFIGEVVSITGESKYLKIKFDVLASYKGINERSYIIVKTAKSSSACGFPFKIKERYLVFTYGEDAFYTGICSRTRLLADAREIITFLPKPIFSLINETEEYSDEFKKMDIILKQIESDITKYKDEKLLLKIKDARIILRDYAQTKSNQESKPPMIGCPPCPPCAKMPAESNASQLNEEDFFKFFSEYKKANSDKDKLILLESLMNSGKYLNVSQAISLLKQIDFSSSRKEFFTLIKGHISDPQNIYQIYNHLDFQSEKVEAKRILEAK